MKALITGITGQDGSYLAELLLNKGYEVHGIMRRASMFNTHRIDHIYVDAHNSNAKLFLHYGDLSDPGPLTEIIYNIRPEEIYHLGAQSHVRVSFDMPEYTGDITGLGTTRLLEAIKRSAIKTKLYQASSSEMYGGSQPPQNENTPFRPLSPYAIAKVYSYWMAVNYRQAYRIFISNGILFNHESPRRGELFVTRKITRAVSNIVAGNQKKIYLGNLDSRRDWGFAPEFVQAMWTILQQDRADDYVVGTGRTHSAREFLLQSLEYVGIEVECKGSGLEERGYVKSFNAKYHGLLRTGDIIYEIDPRYFRPTEVNDLQADFAKARRELGWNPKILFPDLVKVMVDYDLLQVGLEPPGEGIRLLKREDFSWTNHEIVLREPHNKGIV